MLPHQLAKKNNKKYLFTPVTSVKRLSDRGGSKSLRGTLENQTGEDVFWWKSLAQNCTQNKHELFSIFIL